MAGTTESTITSRFGAVFSFLDIHTCLNSFRPVHGLIFLFKYVQNEPATGKVVTDIDLLERIYFSKQVCNTQFILYHA